MKRMTVLLLAALASASAMSASRAPTISAKRLSADVRTLSSDAFEGRAPATNGEKRTVDFIVSQMRAAGLQPGGDLQNGKRAWTQDVPLGRFLITGTPSFSLSSHGQTQALTQGTEIAIRAAMTNVSQVDIDNAALVFVGYGVTAPERQWDDFKGVDLHGKIAVVLINDPDFETGKGDFGGKAMTYYGRWTYKYEEAARRGAVGLLIVHETDAASYGWATVKASNTSTMFDIVRQNPAEKHPVIEGWMQRDLAVDLFKRAGLDFDAVKATAQTREFVPVDLGATLSAHYAVDAQVITSHNVIGVLPGTSRKDEHVIYSGHWDHFGVGEPDANGDRIFNGAVDNATGIASLLELARAYAKAPRTQRSVMFMALTAEERGLLGSEYYAANPIYPLATTAGVINIDALSPGQVTRNFTISGSAKFDLLDDLVAVARRDNVRFSPDPHPEAGYFFRSDHFPFSKRGVPAVSFDSGNDLLIGGIAAGEAESEAYRRDKYHQPDDEWQADWTFAGMQRDLGILYTLGRELADSGRWPNWSSDSEFRAARDASAESRQ